MILDTLYISHECKGLGRSGFRALLPFRTMFFVNNVQVRNIERMYFGGRRGFVKLTLQHFHQTPEPLLSMTFLVGSVMLLISV